MDYHLGSFEHLAAVIKERDQLKQECEELRKIHQKLDLIIDSIGFRLPFAQKGDNYGRQKESDRSRIEGGSPGQT